MAIPMTQSLLAVALSMGIYICNSTLFLYYSADANFLFGRKAINAMLSGQTLPLPEAQCLPFKSVSPLRGQKFDQLKIQQLALSSGTHLSISHNS